jgi:hypothetical protein
LHRTSRTCTRTCPARRTRPGSRIPGRIKASGSRLPTSPAHTRRRRGRRRRNVLRKNRGHQRPVREASYLSASDRGMPRDTTSGLVSVDRRPSAIYDAKSRRTRRWKRQSSATSQQPCRSAPRNHYRPSRLDIYIFPVRRRCLHFRTVDYRPQ